MSAKTNQKANWIKEQAQKYQQNPQDVYYNLVEGNNIVNIDINVPPRDATSKFLDASGKPQKRKVYTLADGRKMSVPIGVDREIIKFLVMNITDLVITREGTGTATRYLVAEYKPEQEAE